MTRQWAYTARAQPDAGPYAASVCLLVGAHARTVSPFFELQDGKKPRDVAKTQEIKALL
jgi:hypothetical protein